MRKRRLAAVACVLSVISNAAMAHRGDEPVSREYEPQWVERNKLLDERLRQGGSKAEMLFIGDSITELWEREGKNVWAKNYVPCGALNLGIGSDLTQHVIWRLDHMPRQNLNPKLIVLMIGTNNIPYISGQGQTVEQAADGIKAVVLRLRHYFPESRILLLGIFPRSERPDRMRGEAYQINQLVRRFKADPRVDWLDLADDFVADDGSIPTKLMPDGLHLSEEGYRIWAERIRGEVARYTSCK